MIQTVETNLQHLHAGSPDDGPMQPFEACNRGRLMELLIRDGIIVYDENGVRVADLTAPSSNNCAALLGVPISPWGSRDLMHMYALPGIPALNDVSPPLLGATLRDGAQVLEQFIQNSGAAYMGVNNSMGSYGLHKRGLMSIPWPHTHYFQIDHPDGNTATDLHRRRAEFEIHDDGLGKVVATRLTPDIQNVVSHYWGNAYVTSDQLGYTVSFPGFSPQHLHKTGFIPDFFHHLSLVNHGALRGIYRATYGIELDQNIQATMRLRDSQADQNTFNALVCRNRAQFARMPTIDPHDPWFVEASILRLLGEDRSRLGGGWAAALEFHPDGATCAVVLGFTRGHVGPVQALGYELHRKSEFHDFETQKELEAHYVGIRDQLLANEIV